MFKKISSSLQTNTEKKSNVKMAPSPSTQVTKLPDGVCLIKWELKITSTEDLIGSSETTFKLDHYYSCCPFFKLTLRYYKVESEPDQCKRCTPDIEFVVALTVKHEACPSVLCMGSNNKPAAVWACVENSQKFILEPKNLTSWKSKTFPFIPDGSECDTVEFRCQLWIKFSKRGNETKVHRQISNLFVKQLHCDVTFCFDEIEEDEPIGGHVAILSARSSVFDAMFQNEMQEKSTRKVCIKDIKPNIFKELLHYIYSGQTSTELSEDFAQLLFVAADKYDIEDLKDECVQFLLTCIKLENAINLLAWAHVHSVDSIEEATLNFMGSRGEEICQKDDWKRLMKNYPDICLLATRCMWK